MAVSGRQITVLGAGVAGLAVAQALARRGAEVTVLEQADAIREVGAGLQISPNGAAVLRALGLEPALAASSVRAAAVQLINGETAEPVLRLDLAGRWPDHGFHFVHRADLIALLAEGLRAAGGGVRLLTRAEGVDLSGARPRIALAGGTDALPGILIGADGLHSKVRGALNGAATPFFTGQVAWRAVIEGEADAPAVAEVHMGPGRHLVSYPLRGGRLRNIVAVEERSRWAEEGWNLRDDPMALRVAFQGFAPRVLGWLEQVQDVWLWGLFRHPVAECWGRAMPDGGAVILGDAAHPTLPFLAQGANMALEDAWVLAAALDEEASLGAALARYQRQREGRVRRIVAAANTNARAYHLSGLGRALTHAGLRIGGRWAENMALRRFDWLYGQNVTQAPL